MPWLLLLVALVIVAAVWAISIHNRLRRLQVKVEEADSGIDVALTKRFDTLTKMRDVCAGFARHETELLTDLVELRGGMSPGEKAEANRRMDTLQGRLNVIAESYPQLRSSDAFVELEESVQGVENHLQAARRLYNMNVSRFNQEIAVFPNSLVAGGMHMTPLEFFDAEESKTADVAMNF